MSVRTDYLYPVARTLLALIFVASGLAKIPGWDRTAAMMAAEGMPWVPLFLVGAIVVEVLGGLSVLFGYRARWGALALAAFLVPTTLIFHDFWTFAGMERQIQMIMFMKNLSIMGGLLFVAATGAGPFSLDARREGSGDGGARVVGMPSSSATARAA
ncbi:MAG: DoxX family protein [Deltaproteobacteria bacterium]|nr:MAG: DoxX family protein [Deltaproteobacteria bacterium]